jgi:cell division septation protein DedD
MNAAAPLHRRTVTAARLVWLCGATAVAAVAPASAQSSPALQAAMRLSAEGRTDSAKRVVAAVLARARAGDTLYIEALYVRGRLGTVDSAERDLRRVAIEYSTSRWADDALLQLAQLGLASGNASQALTFAQRLRGDYPGSELRAPAALWAGRAAFETGDPVTACALLDSARAESAADIELQNQVGFYRARCTTALLRSHPRAPPPDDTSGPVPAPTPAPAPPTAAPRPGVAPAAPVTPPHDTARPVAAPAPATPIPPAVASGEYEVQVAAARSDTAAQRIAARFTGAGMTARVLAGSDGYFRVRLGPYATLQAARDAALAARRFVADRPFVVRR